MPTFDNPTDDASEAREALRGLAHATRSMKDPTDIYPTLGSLSMAAASMSQSLHQLASFHDTPDPGARAGWTLSASAGTRAASNRVSWELHRAGEILRHAAESIDHAHEAEATIVYDHRDFPGVGGAPDRSFDHGIGL